MGGWATTFYGGSFYIGFHKGAGLFDSSHTASVSTISLYISINESFVEALLQRKIRIMVSAGVRKGKAGDDSLRLLGFCNYWDEPVTFLLPHNCTLFPLLSEHFHWICAPLSLSMSNVMPYPYFYI